MIPYNNKAKTEHHPVLLLSTLKKLHVSIEVLCIQVLSFVSY